MNNARSSELTGPEASSSVEPQLNVFKTALTLLVLYFVGAGILGAVLAAAGAPLHPIGLLVLWFASSALVAKRISRRYVEQPPIRLCTISLLLAISIYAMIAIAVGLRGDAGFSPSFIFQMALFSAVMMIAGLAAFLATFSRYYRR